MDTMDTKLKPLSKNCATGNTNPEQLSLPREPCSERLPSADDFASV